MATYRPGELDQRIQILRQVKTPDGQGGFTRVPTLVYTLWALVRFRTGSEVFKNEKVDAPVINVFVVRQAKSLVIEDTDIIRWEGDEYNIRPMSKGKRKMYLEIEAEKGVAL